MRPDPSFNLLVVCTGNVCRSPVAERLLAARLGERAAAGNLDITVASAGVGALVGMGIDAPSAQALAELGIDPAGHRARQLETAMIDSADLLLTAATAHRSTIVRSVPLAFRRCFTLREFARLGAALGPLPDPVDRTALVQRVRTVADQRGQVDPPAAGADEVADPFGAPLEQARVTAGVIAEAVDGVIEALGL